MCEYKENRPEEESLNEERSMTAEPAMEERPIAAEPVTEERPIAAEPVMEERLRVAESAETPVQAAAPGEPAVETQDDGTYRYSYRRSVENPEEYRRPPYMRDEVGGPAPQQKPFEFKLRAANSDNANGEGTQQNTRREPESKDPVYGAGRSTDSGRESGGYNSEQRYSYGRDENRNERSSYNSGNGNNGGYNGGNGGNGGYNGGNGGNGGYNGGSDWNNPRGPKKNNKKTVALIVCLAVLAGGLIGAACYSVGNLVAGAKNAAVSSSSGSIIEELIPGSEAAPSSDETTAAESAVPSTEDKAETSANPEIAIAPEASGSSSVIIQDVSGVVDKCMPSVVAITTKTVYEYYNNYGYNPFFGYGYGYGSGQSNTYEVEGAGSGIIIGDDGTELWIVTNNHVVEDSNEVHVSFCDDSTVSAYIKGTDPSNDLAVVGVKLADMDDATKKAICAIRMGDSDSLRLGEGVIAIGNALGIGQSVTTGVVSAVNREINTDENTTLTTIQTDCAINPGNSGGALLNSSGELIGINVAKSSESNTEGMGFAIPISSAKNIIEKLTTMEPKEAVADDQYPYLGVQLKDMDSSVASAYGIPVGILVYAVEENSPAKEGGMLEQDIITNFNGTAVSTYNELVNELRYYPGGTEVTVIVKRLENGEYVEKELKIKLGLKSDYVTEESTEESGQGSAQPGVQESQPSGIEELIPGFGDR